MSEIHCTYECRSGESAVRPRRKRKASASALWSTISLLALGACSGGEPSAAPITRGASSTPVAAGGPGITGAASNTPVGATKTGTGAMTPAMQAAITAPGATPSGMGMMGVPNFDGQASLEVFTKTLYPILQMHCAACHSEAPDGRDQLPLHASKDPATAHMWALTKINLRQPGQGRLAQRQGLEGHNCWSKNCVNDSKEIIDQIKIWSNAVKSTLPVNTLMMHPGEVLESEVLGWINADKSKLAAGDAQFIKYASLHRLQNRNPTPDDMSTARVGLSKILNSTSYGPKLVNPVAIDPFNLVYRFDIRDYWGFSRSAANPARSTNIWARIIKGNFNADDQVRGPNTFANKDTPTTSLAMMTPTFPNIAGFYPDYVDGTQLGYTLSRPDVYADIMELGTNSAGLELGLGAKESGVDDWKFVTVDDAITINKRMLLRQSSKYGYFWKGVDPFGQSPWIFYDRPIPEMDGFSLVKTTPVFATDGSYRMDNGLSVNADGTLAGGPQAQASEMIFSLPNGLQGYFIGGAANQIRVDAFPFIVWDPRRGGTNAQAAKSGFRSGPFSELRLVTPASCMGCHLDGMNRAVDDMDLYINANPTKFDAKTVARVRQLYMGLNGVRKVVEEDRAIYSKAMSAITDKMIVGMADKTVYYEPIMYLFENAQTIFNYVPTASN